MKLAARKEIEKCLNSINLSLGLCKKKKKIKKLWSFTKYLKNLYWLQTTAFSVCYKSQLKLYYQFASETCQSSQERLSFKKKLGMTTLNYAGTVRARVSSAFGLDGIEYTHCISEK